MSGCLHKFNLLDGQRPEIRLAEQRRVIDPEELANKYFPEIRELEDEFISSGGKVVDEYYTTSRGVKVYTRTVIPGRKEYRGGVLLCHGYTTHLRYQHKRTMYEYAARGFLVTGIENEGHGWSDGLCGHIPSAENIILDVYEFHEVQKEKYPGLRWLVHGESAGGMVALNLCLRAQEDAERDNFIAAVLVAPMCKIADDVKPPKLVENSLVCLAKLLPTWSVTPSAVNTKMIFKQQDMVSIMDQDPIRYAGRPRLATAKELLFSTIELEKHIPDLETPFFTIHGELDLLTTSEGSRELYDLAVKVAPEDKHCNIVKGGWHGIMWAEEETNEHWKEMIAWAEGRFEGEGL